MANLASLTAVAQLEADVKSLASAVQTVADHYRDMALSTSPTNSAMAKRPLPIEVPIEVHRTRREALTTLGRLHAMLAEPVDFIQHLASQTQLLACLQWLGEFQILACVPLTGSVASKDVAGVAGVPVVRLRRVVRLTANAGFLHEPETGYIGHTALSAPFVTNLYCYDAVMFLAETAAPSALQMAAATACPGGSSGPKKSAFMLASNSVQTFPTTCENRAKLQRQWPAYLHCIGGQDPAYEVNEVLCRLDWPSLGNMTVVIMGHTSPGAARELSAAYPSLHFVVQLDDEAQNEGSATVADETQLSHITVQKRAAGATQTAKEGAIYILHVPPAWRVPRRYSSQLDWIASELRAHLGVLRLQRTANLILVAQVLPEPGAVDRDVEAVARLRDLSLLQLADHGELDMGELTGLVESVGDGAGKLSVSNKSCSLNSTFAALEINYQRSHESGFMLNRG